MSRSSTLNVLQKYKEVIVNNFWEIIEAGLITVLLFEALPRICSTIKKKSPFISQEDTYSKSIKETQELNRAIKEFRNAWHIAKQNDILAQKIAEEERIEFLSEWEVFSVTEMLNTETIGQFYGAKKLAFKGSLAAKFAPLQHEEISMRAVEVAGDDVEKLLKAARNAPRGGVAANLAFSKLQRLLRR